MSKERHKKMKEICTDILKCPKREECQKYGSMFGEKQNNYYIRPSPHVGGDKIEDFCILFVGQNPGDPTPINKEFDKAKFNTDDSLEFLLYHDKGLRDEFEPGKFIKKLELKWNYVVWENAVKCPTKNNGMDKKLAENCKFWLDKQIQTLRPEISVGVGRWGREALGLDEFGKLKKDLNNTILYSMPHYSYLRKRPDITAVKNFKEKIHPHIPDEVKL